MKRLLFLLPFLLIGLLAGEGIARIMTCPIPQRDSNWIYLGSAHWEDRDGFRRADGERFPEKGSRKRILAVGDSLTYGKGVPIEAAWPAQLEALTGYEVLNLGQCGRQAGDLAEILRQALAKTPSRITVDGKTRPGRLRYRWGDLQPDLIVYGLCLNDLLPAGVRQADAYDWLLQTHSALARLIFRAVAPSIHEDISAHGSVPDFRRSAAEMEALVENKGLPPIIAMALVTPQVFDADLERTETQALRQAGMRVVPADYLQGHEREDWRVHPLDPHPNARAHRIYAEALAPMVRTTLLGEEVDVRSCNAGE